MCEECGCDHGSKTTVPGLSAGVKPDLNQGLIIPLHEGILDRNSAIATHNREKFRASGTLVLNMMSSPGAGKTALIARMLADRHQGLRRIGVIVGDLSTDRDAQRLIRVSPEPAAIIQITTGALCHLNAQMIEETLYQMDLNTLDILVIENVGNLVCPAAFDLGETLRVVVLSVTEGEDKPLKYPIIFKSSHAILINKIDIAEAVNYQRQTAHSAIRQIAPGAALFEVSAQTGEGLDQWYQFLQLHCPQTHLHR